MNTDHLTPEDITEAWRWADGGNRMEVNLNFIRLLPDPPQKPSRPMLLPIVDPMPPVSEGCVRVFGVMSEGRMDSLCHIKGNFDTCYTDILLPVEDDRAEFEWAVVKTSAQANLERKGNGYSNPTIQFAFEVWTAAKKAGKEGL